MDGGGPGKLGSSVCCPSVVVVVGGNIDGHETI